MYCLQCGRKINEGQKNCPDCKISINTDLFYLYQEKDLNAINKKDRLTGIFSYLGPLWILAFLRKKDNKKYLNFHINQGFTLFLIYIVAALLFLTPKIGLITGILLITLSVFLSYFGISEIIKTQKEQLPIVGDFTFLDKILK